MTIWALIAAFNEAPNIARVVQGVRPHVSRVLVVDDGSSDGTGERAANAGAIVIRHQVNRGKGAAIRTGIAAALAGDASHVLMLDGDGQHDPADAPALIEAARDGRGDFVLGERLFDRATMPGSRYWTNRISSRVISRYFVGTEVGDAQSGYRLVSADLLRRLRLTGRGYEIETEMLIKAAQRGARFARVPIHLRYDGAVSKLRPWRDTTRTCVLAVRYRFFPERAQ
jgi:glycosyltransferase involved in cell wall biosynthesis